MRERWLSSIAASVGGSVVGEDTVVSSVAVDSRNVGPGALFVALPGDRSDGHEFVPDAFAAGAAGAVVARQGAWNGPVVLAEDPGRALLALAADERAAMHATVVGVTGSTGKTCTKDLAAAILDARFAVRASPASFNNEVGVPLTVLGADADTEILVCEMGSRGIGHISMLCDVARPHIGIVTNVGLAHLELFGSRENIVRAKGELVEALPTDGTAILNADDDDVRAFAARTDARVLTFGLKRDADLRGEDVALDDEGRPSFSLVVDGVREQVELSVPGEHMVSNALAAAACGMALGVSPAECATALKGASVSAWRMESFTIGDDVRVVNDAYNANPTSMAAALHAARWLARGRRLIAVLGHMAELGPVSQEEHERLGSLVARMEVDRLITVGEQAREIERAAVREGMALRDVSNRASIDDALADLREHLRPRDVVLIKASRVAGLERLAEMLREDPA
ncbi:MAG: UDP-N-acetylmuramoyl-tripeptide--D-alanyl-D-alanine ligase [Actinomycetota bacterium]